MRKTTITVIIPCYKPDSDKLRCCLESLRNQTFSDFDVLIVDDGNDEKDRKLLDEISGEYHMCSIIHMQHQGVSAARNYGIQMAEGEYVAFTDADDIVTPWFLAQAFTLAKQYETDFIAGLYCMTNSSNLHSITDNPKPVIHEYCQNQIDKKCLYLTNKVKLSNNVKIHVGPGAKLVKSSIAKRVKFDENIVVGEDMIWGLDLLRECKRVIAVENVWYLYINNCDSVTKRFDLAMIAKRTDMIDAIISRIDLKDTEILAEFGDFIWGITHVLSETVFSRVEYRKVKKSERKRIEELMYHYPWTVVCSREYRSVANIKCKMKSYMFQQKLWVPYLKAKTRFQWILRKETGWQ